MPVGRQVDGGAGEGQRMSARSRRILCDQGHRESYPHSRAVVEESYDCRPGQEGSRDVLSYQVDTETMLLSVVNKQIKEASPGNLLIPLVSLNFLVCMFRLLLFLTL